MSNNFLKNKKLKVLGFSLIELAIVLIIISLITTGIIGSSSIIENARIRGLANEFVNYRQALNTFYIMKGRLPGDLTGTWRIGYKSGQTYTASSFPAPYNDNSNGYGIPNIFSAPFVDLYLAKVINFEPKSTNINAAGNFASLKPLADAGGIPKSNAIKDFIFSYRFDLPDVSTTYFRYNNKETISIQIFIDGENKIAVRVIKKLDLKIDDGIWNTGNLRSYCADATSGYGYTSYEYAKRCIEVIFFSDL